MSKAERKMTTWENKRVAHSIKSLLIHIYKEIFKINKKNMDIGYENGTRTQTSNLLKQYKWPINMEVHSTLVRNLHKL